MAVIVIDESLFVVGVLARKAKFILFSHVTFSRNDSYAGAVFVQCSAVSVSPFPKDGGDILQNVMQVVEMLLTCASFASQRVIARMRVAVGSVESQI